MEAVRISAEPRLVRRAQSTDEASPSQVALGDMASGAGVEADVEAPPDSLDVCVPSERRSRAASLPQHSEAALGTTAFAVVDLALILFLLACFLSSSMAALLSGDLVMRRLGGSLGSVVAAAPTGLAVYLLVYSLLLIGVKRCIVGKLPSGRFPIRGKTYIRWLLWDRLVAFGNNYVWFPWLIDPVPSVYSALWRAFGAQLGAGCRIGKDTFFEGSLERARIADGSSVQGIVSSVALVGGELLVADTVLEQCCLVGAGAVVEPGCVVRASTRLEAGTVLPMGAVVGGPGLVVLGSPARVRGSAEAPRSPSPAAVLAGSSAAELSVAVPRTRSPASPPRWPSEIANAAGLMLIPLQFMAAYAAGAAVFATLAPPDTDPVRGVAAAIGAGLIAVIVVQNAMLVVAVFAKWLLLGRLRDGQRITASFRLRKRLVDMLMTLPLKLRLDAFTAWLTLRCLGARIHRSVLNGNPKPSFLFTDYDLVNIGANVFLGGGATAEGSRADAEGDEFLTSISIAPNVYVGGTARLCAPVAIPERCAVAAKSVVHSFCGVQPGSVLRGNPARQAGRIPTAANECLWRDLLTMWGSTLAARVPYLVLTSCTLVLMQRLGLVIWAAPVGVLITAVEWLLWLVLCGRLSNQPLSQKDREEGVRFQRCSARYWLWVLNVSAHACLSQLFGPVLRGSFLVPVVYRLWGASIGRGVCMHNPNIWESQFLQIEDGATLGADSSLSAHSVEVSMEVTLLPITLGPSCTLLPYASLHGGTSVPAGVLLGSYAKPLTGQLLEPGREYDGAPCRTAAHGAPARRPGHTGGSAFLQKLETWSTTQPEKPLMCWHTKGRAPADLSFVEVARASGQLAWRLRAQWGLHAGERLLLVFLPGSQFALAMIACLRAQVVAVPVYPPGPRSFRQDLHRLQQVVEICEARAMLSDDGYWAAFRKLRAMEGLKRGPAACCGSGGLRLPPWLVAPAASNDVSLPELGAEGPPADGIGFLQFSSGSTGMPKGVIIQHHHLDYQLVKNSGGNGVMFSREDVACSWLPQYHDLGLIFGVFMVAFNGATGHYMSPEAFLQDPGYFVEIIGKAEATVSGMPNLGFQMMVDRLEPREAVRASLSSLRTLLVGAEFTRPATMQVFCDKFGFPPEKINSGYGLAEHVLFVTGHGSVTDIQDGRVSVGSPGEGVQVCIVDFDSRRAAPTGTDGEIWIQSPCVCAGYWGRTVETRETFAAQRADEPSSGDWLRTGDIGRIRSGKLFIMGRRKELMILGGRNFYAEDVEACVSDLPGVRKGRSVAFSVEAEAGERLVVLVECRTVGRTSRRAGVHEELLRRVREAVPAACGIAPATVAVLAPGSALKTSSGKLRRRETREAWAAGQLDVLASRSWSDDQRATAEPSAAVSEAAVVAVGPSETDMSAQPLPEKREDVVRELGRRLREDYGAIAGPATARTRIDNLALTSMQQVAFVGDLRTTLPTRARPRLELADVLEVPALGALADLLLRLKLEAQGPAGAEAEVALDAQPWRSRPEEADAPRQARALGDSARLADCVVAGGGIVGLCFARDLASLGYKVVVYEASTTIGGIWSTNDYAGLRLHQPGSTYRCLSLAPQWTKGHAASELYRPARDEVVDYIRELANHPGIAVHVGHRYLMHEAKDGGVTTMVRRAADGEEFAVMSSFLCLSLGCFATNSGAPVVPVATALKPPEEQPASFPLCLHSSAFSADMLARARAAPGRVVVVGSGKAALDVLGQFEASQVHIWMHRGHTYFLNRDILNVASEDSGQTWRRICSTLRGALEEPFFVKCRGPPSRRRQPFGGGVASPGEVAHADSFCQLILDDVLPHDAGGLLLTGRDPDASAEFHQIHLGAGDVVIFCTGQRRPEWALPRYEAGVATVKPMTTLSSPLNALLPLCLALDHLEGDGVRASRLQERTNAWAEWMPVGELDPRDVELECCRFLSAVSQESFMTAAIPDLGLLPAWRREWHGQDLEVRKALHSLGFGGIVKRGVPESDEASAPSAQFVL